MSEDVLLALCISSRTRRRAALALRDLRCRLNAERRRWEWSRAVRMRHYITLPYLKAPRDSPRMEAWLHGTDSNFLAITSLTRTSYSRLLERFIPHYPIVTYSPKGGRPRKLPHHHQVLGLLMAFYVGSMHRAQLCQQFGAPPSTLSRVFNSAEASLAEALRGFSPARIVWPTLARQKALAQLIALRQPMLSFTWGFLDGKNLRVQEPSEADVQNAHYNGWLHNVFVTGTLCFSADGLIVWANIIALKVGATET